MLDKQPQDDVVAAVIRPTLTRWEQARQLHHQPKLVGGVKLPAVTEIPAVRLEELHDVTDEIRQATRMVQELAHGDALGERRGVAVELEEPVVAEPEDERGDEDLRHAADAKAVIDRQRLARSHVGEPGRRGDRPRRQKSDYDGARYFVRHEKLELLLDRVHGL